MFTTLTIPEPALFTGYDGWDLSRHDGTWVPEGTNG